MSAAIQANPQRNLALETSANTATGSVAVLPVDTAVEWLPGWTEDTTTSLPDIVSFVLWIRDPMYRTAAPGVRRAMEREEASVLLQSSEKAWRDHNGRQRGWVRKHLEEDLRARSSGADPAPDAWELVRTNRRAALLVDYVCVMHATRVGLWWPEHHAVTVIGIGDRVVNLNCTSGRALIGSTGWIVHAPSWPTLLGTAKDMAWVPAACAPSMGTMTVAQIQEALMAIQPDALKTGGRLVIWNRLQWARLVRSLKGLPDPIETDVPHTIADPALST